MGNPGARMAELVRAYGPRGAARRAAAIGRERLRLDVDHLWYELDLHAERPRPPLPEGCALVAGGDEHLRLVAAIGRTPAALLPRYRAEGGKPWLVLSGGVPVFSCWIFTGRVPTVVARGGWLDVPAGAAFLEESVTAPAGRGRGIAPAAWSRIADALAASGVRRMLSMVETTNAPSRRAVAKAGFKEVAASRFTRRGTREHVGVAVLEPEGDWLCAALSR